MTQKLLPVAMMAAACGGGSGPDSGEEAALGFEVAAEFPLSQSGDTIVASVAQVLYWDGSVAVVDWMDANIKLFDPESGALRQVLGRRGQGPGEFDRPQVAAVATDGRLVVLDLFSQRISFFRPGGEFDASWQSSGFFGGLATSDAGSLVMTGELLEEVEPVTRLEVHEFALDGTLLTSSSEVPDFEHPQQGAWDHLKITIAGDRRVALRTTSNEVMETRRDSDTTQTRSIGAAFYRSPDAPSERGMSSTETEQWLKSQFLAWHLFSLEDGSYVVGFLGPDPDTGESGSWWIA